MDSEDQDEINKIDELEDSESEAQEEEAEEEDDEEEEEEEEDDKEEEEAKDADVEVIKFRFSNFCVDGHSFLTLQSLWLIFYLNSPIFALDLFASSI